MIEFGKTLREAREAKGYTIAQVSEMTNVMHSILENLEKEDFTKIVAPIYGRGFVKLYCEAVGLDPKPLIAEFMEILNGNRDVTIRERVAPGSTPAEPAVPPPAEPIRPTEPEPLPQPKPSAPEPEPTVEADVAPEPSPEPPPIGDLFNMHPIAEDAAKEPDRFRTEETDQTPLDESRPKQTGLSRFASPFQPKDYEKPSWTFSLPENFWRMAVLIGGGIALIVLIAFGLVALYKATSGNAPTTSATSEGTEPEARQAAPAQPVKPAAAAVPRTPQKIPSLYVD